MGSVRLKWGRGLAQFARVVATSSMNHGKSSSRLYWHGIFIDLDNTDESACGDRVRWYDTIRSMDIRRHALVIVLMAKLTSQHDKQLNN